MIPRSLVVDRFERSEAVEAIKVRASGSGIALTTLQRNELAAALGDDPLLIGLNNDWLAPSPRAVFQSYVTANINEVADETLLASDHRQALDELAERLVQSRIIYPEWHQIRNWFKEDGDVLKALRHLIDQGKIIHLGSNNERLAFRHDRIRDHLLTQAIRRLIEECRFSLELWKDPFYVPFIGGALSSLPLIAIGETARLNPAALFSALQDMSLEDERRAKLIEAAKEWIGSPGFSDTSATQQRHHAMQYLARIDSSFTAALAQHFTFSFPQLEALVRNGSVRAGAVLCANSGPGMNDKWRDRLIAHALSSHANFVTDLAALIRQGELTPALLEGALNLAGEIGDPALCDALALRWIQQDGNTLSTGWLWAALRCCPPISHKLADTLCDRWGGTPNQGQAH